jgi:hypothetical protein
MNKQILPSIIALAGRRIDKMKSSPARFPESQVPLVSRRIADLLEQEFAEAVVSSAACGADLIGLERAERLRVRRRIVLPFSPDHFRQKSVLDCPGEWVRTFDRLVAEAATTGDLVVLDGSEADSRQAFEAANGAIISEARHLALPGNRRLVAAIVWEGQARGESDATEAFRALALEAGFELRTVLTTGEQ